ncbi:Enc1 [Symbiodinium sp. CCMP2456]|nr:Enc1 [Symbiodinium sp. CCMP2456]
MSEASFEQVSDAKTEVLEGAATTEELSDVVLDFGVDSMPANSVLLRMASPVFNRMFQSGMKEAQQSIIKVDVAGKEEFTIFYNLLGPVAWNARKVTKENVDTLLAISDYYQVETIKQTCEDLLLDLPPTGTRLLQAHQHCLKRQYQRCIHELAKKSAKEDLEVIWSQPDVFFELTLKKQDILNRVMATEADIRKCMVSFEKYLGTMAASRFTEGAKFSQSHADQLSELTRAREPVKRLLERLLKELQ